MTITNKYEIWKWNNIVKDFLSSGLTKRKYCEQKNICYKKFCNKIYRIRYKMDSNPTEYSKMCKIAKNYSDSGQPIGQFCKENNVNRNLLSEVMTHFTYLEIIEKVRKEKEADSGEINFIEVKPKDVDTENSNEYQVIEKKNDIELVITKGVKVSISANIDSMKIIKIIELLKDL